MNAWLAPTEIFLHSRHRYTRAAEVSRGGLVLHACVIVLLFAVSASLRAKR